MNILEYFNKQLDGYNVSIIYDKLVEQILWDEDNRMEA